VWRGPRGKGGRQVLLSTRATFRRPVLIARAPIGQPGALVIESARWLLAGPIWRCNIEAPPSRDKANLTTVLLYCASWCMKVLLEAAGCKS